ncbi:MAG: hypothetical protein ACE5GL_05690 [Calditrichia bacterium]
MKAFCRVEIIWLILLLACTHLSAQTRENSVPKSPAYLNKGSLSIISGFGFMKGIYLGTRYNILKPVTVELTYGNGIFQELLGGDVYVITTGVNYYFIANRRGSLFVSFLGSYVSQKTSHRPNQEFFHLYPSVGFEELLTGRLSFIWRFGYGSLVAAGKRPEVELNYNFGLNFKVM